MVKILQTTETLTVRSVSLRDGEAPEKCTIPEDEWAGVFHMGYEIEGEIVATASFFPNNLDNQEGKGYQLRLMGVLPAYQGKGIGYEVLQAGIELLIHTHHADYVWCKAREVAYPFYEKSGFVFCSEAYVVEKRGIHRSMIRSLTAHRIDSSSQ